MKTKLFKLTAILVLISLFVSFIFWMKGEDLPEYDPEKELAHLLVKNQESGSNNSVENVETNTSTQITTVKENTRKTKVTHSKEVTDYFNEIVFKSEFDGKIENSLKWTEDVKIYVDGSNVSYLNSELKKIVGELNDIIDPINIRIVSNKSDANIFIYIGGCENFKQNYKVFYPELLVKNWGYFEIIPNDYAVINVDINRAKDPSAQKHLLREELTQSLGLLNDSYKYPESIFYQGWTTTTEYAPIDRELIDMLYNN